MIKELNKACKKVNDNLGVSIELPELRKNTLKAAGERDSLQLGSYYPQNGVLLLVVLVL